MRDTGLRGRSRSLMSQRIQVLAHPAGGPLASDFPSSGSRSSCGNGGTETRTTLLPPRDMASVPGELARLVAHGAWTAGTRLA